VSVVLRVHRLTLAEQQCLSFIFHIMLSSQEKKREH
jgi:hypothetical protein